MTYAEIIAKARRLINFDERDINTLFLDFLNRKRDELCEAHNFRWLTIHPAYITELPVATYALYDGWFDEGWLVTQPSVVEYDISMLSSPDLGQAGGFSEVAVTGINWIKRFSMDNLGECEGELRVLPMREFVSRYAIEDDSQTTITGASLVIPYNDSQSSILRTGPLTTERILLAMEYTVKRFPAITNTNTSDYVSTMYPWLLIDGVVAEAAAYFEFEELQGEYVNKWFGDRYGRYGITKAINDDNKGKRTFNTSLGYDTGARRANGGLPSSYTSKNWYGA